MRDDVARVLPAYEVDDEIGRGGYRRMDIARAHDAYRLLMEGANVLGPLASIERPDLELTVAQRAYAKTLALLAAMRASFVRTTSLCPTTSWRRATPTAWRSCPVRSI